MDSDSPRSPTNGVEDLIRRAEQSALPPRHIAAILHAGLHGEVDMESPRLLPGERAMLSWGIELGKRLERRNRLRPVIEDAPP